MADAKDLSASLEDYLEAIYHIIEEKQAAKAKDIAVKLAVNSSSVTGALKALAKRELVNYAPYDLITLTPAGEDAAKEVIKRHKALYNFFVSVLSVDESEAEETACKLEHEIPPSILRRLIAFVKFVDKCPIGGATWVESKGYFCDRNAVIQHCPDCAEHGLKPISDR